MKTLEELRLLSPTQLKGIAQSLGVEPPKLDYRTAENREKLVMLVYDVQQPQTPTDAQDLKTVKLDDNPPPPASVDIEKRLELIADTFGARLEDIDIDENGAVIYSVIDLVEDEEVRRGTYAELWALVQEKLGAPTETLGEVPLSEPETEAPPVAIEGVAAEVEKHLNALRRTGLTFEVNGGLVKMCYRSETVTTTLNQPLHRIIRVAEHLCKVA